MSIVIWRCVELRLDGKEQLEQEWQQQGKLGE